MSILANWTTRVKQLKLEVYTVYLAIRDPRVPWPVRLLGWGIVAHAISPIDLIPDCIPVIGLLLKFLPKEILDEHRERAQVMLNGVRPVSWTAACIIIMIWLLGVGLLVRWMIGLHWH